MQKLNSDSNDSSNESAALGKSGAAAAPVDIFRDTWVRYLGYANEVGEAFRPLYPRFVKPSYGIAFSYVFVDSFDKGWKEYSREGSTPASILKLSSDCLIWQTLASILLPGYTIKYVTKLGEIALQKIVFKSAIMTRFGPTTLGLAAIPLIIHPIDSFVDYLMDNTYRRL